VAPAPRRPRPPLPQRILAAALNQLPLKLAALFFAFVLWLAVSAEEPTDEWVPVRITLSSDSAVSLREPVPAVRAFVIGPGRELLKLYVSEPTLRLTVGDDVPDSLTVPLKASDVVLPAWVNAHAGEIEPSSVTLHFAVRATRKLPIRSELRLHADSGWRIVGDPRFQPGSVMVSGPRDRVRRVTVVATAPQVLYVHDSEPQLVPLDTAGLGLRTEPEAVRVFVPAVRDVPPAIDTASSAPSTPAPAPKSSASKSKGKSSPVHRVPPHASEGRASP
jgi:hypothetical protein